MRLPAVIVFFVSAMTGGAFCVSGETLYNGIVLPDEWPPRDVPFQRFQNGDPAPAPPYVRNPPGVIPMDVGRQLFVDDFLIESTTLRRTFHRPEYYDGNPVLKPDKPWETHSRLGPMAMPFSGGVFWDPSAKLFKMWYMAGYNYNAGLAFSKDGIHWDRPELGHRKRTNLIAIPNNEMHGVWLDLEESDPARRYKMVWHRSGDYSAAVSADGVHWTRSVNLGDLATVAVLATTRFERYGFTPSATAGDGRQVDAILSAYDRPDLPDCALGIIRDGELIYCKGFGSANLDHEVPNTPRTIFEIGSFAKSFTCACIAILMDQGRVSPDDDIRQYLPEMHAFDPPIRVRHLLRCRSGLWAQWHIAQLAGWSAEPVEAPYSENDMLTLLSGQKTLPFEPGTEFRYGTGDYFLLGMIVRRVTGQSLADFAKKNLFEPLGMSQTFIMQNPARIVKRRAIGYYRHHKGHWLQWTQSSAAHGGRGLYTCVEDLYRWDQNFYERRTRHTDS